MMMKRREEIISYEYWRAATEGLANEDTTKYTVTQESEQLVDF